MSAVSILPCIQYNASVIDQRRLPLPICSDRVSSSKWLGGSVQSPRAPLPPPLGHLIESSAAPSHLNAATLRPQPSAIYISSPNKPPASSNAISLTSGKTNTAMPAKTRHSPPTPPHPPPPRALPNPSSNHSPTPAASSNNASQPTNPPPPPKKPKKSTSAPTAPTRPPHKVVERERRRKCSEIIMAMTSHFLPDLLPDVSSKSHKSIVPRNILLEYSLAHIVCLQRRPRSNGGTTTAWQADVAGEIRAFVERRREGGRETEEMMGRKRKRSLSEGTVGGEGW